MWRKKNVRSNMIFFHRFCFYKCINNLLLFKQIAKTASIIETAISWTVNLALPFNGINFLKKLIYGNKFENKFKNI